MEYAQAQNNAYYQIKAGDQNLKIPVPAELQKGKGRPTNTEKNLLDEYLTTEVLKRGFNPDEVDFTQKRIRKKNKRNPKRETNTPKSRFYRIKVGEQKVDVIIPKHMEKSKGRPKKGDTETLDYLRDTLRIRGFDPDHADFKNKTIVTKKSVIQDEQEELDDVKSKSVIQNEDEFDESFWEDGWEEWNAWGWEE